MNRSHYAAARAVARCVPGAFVFTCAAGVLSAQTAPAATPEKPKEEAPQQLKE